MARIATIVLAILVSVPIYAQDRRQCAVHNPKLDVEVDRSEPGTIPLPAASDKALLVVARSPNHNIRVPVFIVVGDRVMGGMLRDSFSAFYLDPGSYDLCATSGFQHYDAHFHIDVAAGHTYYVEVDHVPNIGLLHASHRFVLLDEINGRNLIAGFAPATLKPKR